ncbi:YdeI/OmpD-associated family protein [Patescibacteria group bacterium]|nr:YdeI/OmpD-associated family protein [Patescibacteria group bacterium]
MPQITKTLYVKDAKEWRRWLAKNYNKEKDVWLILPHTDSGKKKIAYNDSVEEALCFGWIDSTVKNFNEHNSIQRFTPRRKGSPYSQTNIERLRLLTKESKVIPEISESTKVILQEKFHFPKDTIAAIQANAEAWRNFQRYSDSYKRIRIAYIEEFRSIPKEYQKRLQYFIKKTARGIQFGYGGIEKYF